MELVTILFLILFLVTIPVMLLVIVAEQYGSDLTIFEACLKFAFSFLVYVVLSIFTLLFLFFAYIGPGPIYGHKTPFENKVVGLIAVFVYGVIGWLLCSLVSGKLIKPWLIFQFNKRKQTQSIFDTR